MSEKHGRRIQFFGKRRFGALYRKWMRPNNYNSCTAFKHFSLLINMSKWKWLSYFTVPVLTMKFRQMLILWLRNTPQRIRVILVDSGSGSDT
jgi:hypothetical protein